RAAARQGCRVDGPRAADARASARHRVSPGHTARLASRCAGLRARRRRVPGWLGAHAPETLSTGEGQADRARARAALGVPDARRGTLAMAAQHPGDARAALLDHLSHPGPAGLAFATP